MKVILAIDRFDGPVAGTETQFWLILNGLLERGIEVCVLTLRPSRFLEEQLPDLPVQVLPVRRVLSPIAFGRAMFLAIWARRNSYRVLHTFLNDVSIVLPWPMRLLGVRVLVSRRDEGFWYTQRLLPILRIVRPAVNRIVANSSAVAHAVERAEGYARDKICVIPNGIPKTDQTGCSERIRKRYGAGAGTIVFTVIANLRPLKRIGDAIHAIARVHTEIPDVCLWIAGADRAGFSGPSHRRELESQILELGAQRFVSFLGHVSDTASIIEASDIGLLCSETEGMSNSLLQFMMAEKPVIATEAGGNVEIVEDNTTGRLVAVGNISELTSACREMASCSRLRQKFGEQAGRVARKRFSVNRLLDDLLSLYSQ